MRTFEENIKPITTLNTQQSKKGRGTFTLKNDDGLIVGNTISFMTLETTETPENIIDNDVLKSSVLRLVDKYLSEFVNLFTIDIKDLINALSYIKKDSKVYVTLKADKNGLTLISADESKMLLMKSEQNSEFEEKIINVDANVILPILKTFKNFGYKKIELCFKGDKITLKNGNDKALICGIRK